MAGVGRPLGPTDSQGCTVPLFTSTSSSVGMLTAQVDGYVMTRTYGELGQGRNQLIL